jgi:protein-S-isoprenylcysteine O-methyltransferase Ste14
MAIRALALIAYASFLAAFVYFIGFVSGVGVPHPVDGVATLPLAAALAVDLGLVLFFGVTHSVMARSRFKRAWTRVVPPAGERSVYVLVASAQMALLCWQWRPIAAPQLWATSGALAIALRALSAAGWAIVLLSSFLIDHFELFGLRQAFGRAAPASALRTPLLYRWVRHPLYFGLLLGWWSASSMGASHLLLATTLTAYILVGVRHEEHDLLRTFGEEYRRYQLAVPMLVPLPWRRGAAPVARGTPSE